jgi:hypothetical protein
MLLLGNAEVACSSTTASTKLLMPGTATATANVARAAATSPLPGMLLQLVPGASSASGTVATPTAHQKRKARP